MRKKVSFGRTDHSWENARRVCGLFHWVSCYSGGAGGYLPSTFFFSPWKNRWEVLLTGPREPRPDCWSLWWGFGVGSALPQGHCSPRPGLAEQRQITFPQQSEAPRGPSSSVGKHRAKWAPSITLTARLCFGHGRHMTMSMPTCSSLAFRKAR